MRGRLYYLLSSQLVKGADLNFILRGVEEISKKLLMRLDNVRSFYELYCEGPSANSLRRSSAPQPNLPQTQNVLDRWILSRLGELVRDTTDGFEKYELDVATRPLASFIDDLSTWYVRRSRDRFKVDGEDKQQALATLRHVLHTTALVMAPPMPFFAEDLFQKVKGEDDAQSVHLANWPSALAVDEQLLKDMARVRELSSLGLQAREAAGVKIRQPLAKLSVQSLTLSPELCQVIADELNVKEIVEDTNITSEGGVALDTELTPELEEEGILRDLTRRIQAWRKDQGLVISDRPAYELLVSGKELIVARKNTDALIVATGLSTLTITETETEKETE